MKHPTNHGKISASLIFVLLLGPICLWPVTNVDPQMKPEEVICWDVISYYAYLPAVFVEHDYTLSFVPTDTNYYQHYWPEYTEDGHCVIKTTMGLSLLYAPFFLTAHLLAEPLGFVADGYSPPYALSLIIAAIVYVVLGCALLRKVLLKYFNETVTTLTLAVITLVTNLFYQTTLGTPMSHSFNFALFCAFVFLTERWYEKPSWKWTVLLGLLLGLIALIRPSNCIIILYFLCYGITGKQELQTQWKRMLHAFPHLLVMALMAVVVWIPQMAYWKSLTGHLFFYSYGGDERFFWGAPKIIKGLFGFRKGWLVYTPVMIFSLLGFIPLYRHQRKFFWPILIFTLLNIYIIFSWWCWWYGGCFGMRTMIDSYALLAIPLASYIAWMLRRKKKAKIALVTLFMLVAALNSFHTVQYHYHAIHYEAMSAKSYWDSFLRVRPSSNFSDLLEWPDYDAARLGNR